MGKCSLGLPSLNKDFIIIIIIIRLLLLLLLLLLLKSYRYFPDLGVEIALSHRLDFSVKANTSIHGLEEDDTARVRSSSSIKLSATGRLVGLV